MRTGLIATGIVVVAVSLGADLIGVGEGTRIGYKQAVGAVVGIVIAIVGFMRKAE